METLYNSLKSEDPLPTRQENHENLMRDCQAEGWTYGVVCDEAMKTRPDLVPFEQLPIQEKIKNYIFLAFVKACRRYLSVSL